MNSFRKIDLVGKISKASEKVNFYGDTGRLILN